jgi:putative ABC transport system permease protein
MKSFARFFYLLTENARMALHSLYAHKLRSILSVTGISIGIFSIVMVYTLIDSFELKIKDSLSSYGKNVVYVEVFPWESDDKKTYPWWKYINRPDPTPAEMKALQKLMQPPLIQDIAFLMSYNVKRLVNPQNALTMTSISANGITYNYQYIQDFLFLHGRYFTTLETDNAQQVAIIGYNLSKQLYGNPEMALGKKIRMDNQNLTIVGVLQQEGESMFQNSMDDKLFIPYQLLDQMAGISSRSYEPKMVIKAGENISIDALASEVKGCMRTVRRLSPDAEDNFAVNKVTFFMDYLRDFFKQVNLFGLIIGGFSLVVGGFGVANIMFVSVKERTNLIGVQKALGAKGYHILQQFLTEAVVLCLLGGIVGLAFVMLVSQLGNYILQNTDEFNFNIIVTHENVFYGVVFSILTGIVSGLIPAWFASRLPPVEAIRSNS